MYGFFAYLSRLRYISRWGLMRNSEPENVQEHSYMTAVLAHALAAIRRDVFGGDADPDAAAAAALFHDAPEVFTGDMPTPVKYFDPVLRSAYGKVEQAAADRLLSALPAPLRPVYGPLVREEQERELVKAADKLAAYLKCVTELHAGNEEFRRAGGQTLAALRAMDLPEIDYFLQNLLPAFTLNLDELEEQHSQKAEENQSS
ncbi:MAG: 5'-deoxynucleotidase [Oscillospiraceae bacterium]|nr:5'-deoxynucleotidase [Oscillospiraceae bacterium]